MSWGIKKPFVYQLYQDSHAIDVKREVRCSLTTRTFTIGQQQQVNQYSSHKLYFLSFLLFFLIQFTEIIFNLNFIFCDHSGAMALYCCIINHPKLSRFKEQLITVSLGSAGRPGSSGYGFLSGFLMGWQPRGQSAESSPRFNVWAAYSCTQQLVLAVAQELSWGYWPGYLPMAYLVWDYYCLAAGF